MAAASSSKRRKKPSSSGHGEMRNVSDCREEQGDSSRAPLETLYEMLGGRQAARARGEELSKAFYRQPTSEETSGYTVALLHTVQNCASEDDLVRVPIEARNKFGVTLLHKACRYPNWVAARYIATRLPRLTSATDDLGRLPLHDACWNDKVDFAVIDILITQEPATLLAQDNRGHTPLCYVPRKAWAQWNAFFRSRHQALVSAFGVVVTRKRELPVPDEDDNGSETSLSSSSSSSSSLSSDESGWESAWLAARQSRSLEFYNSERAKRQRFHEAASNSLSPATPAPAAAAAEARKPRCWTIKQVLNLGELTSSSSSPSLSAAPDDEDNNDGANNNPRGPSSSSSSSSIPDLSCDP